MHTIKMRLVILPIGRVILLLLMVLWMGKLHLLVIRMLRMQMRARVQMLGSIGIVSLSGACAHALPSNRIGITIIIVDRVLLIVIMRLLIIIISRINRSCIVNSVWHHHIIHSSSMVSSPTAWCTGSGHDEDAVGWR